MSSKGDSPSQWARELTQKVDWGRKEKVSTSHAVKASVIPDETHVVDEAESSGSGEEEPSGPISPSESSDERGEEESHEHNQVKVPLRKANSRTSVKEAMRQ